MEKEELISIVKTHKEELKEKYGVDKIGLFGSAARNESKVNSDIDFVVELQKADLFLLAGLKDYLQDLLKTEIDIVRYRENMNALLKQRITREAIYV